jgi:hypothetical protein
VANQMDQSALEVLRATIPAARGLPLLAAIAKRQATTIHLDYLEHLRISVEVTPC